MGAAEKEVPLTGSLHPANSRVLPLFPKTSGAAYRDFIKALESGLLASGSALLLLLRLEQSQVPECVPAQPGAA